MAIQPSLRNTFCIPIIACSRYVVFCSDQNSIHRYRTKIADYYRKKNLEVLIEEKINGRPDIIVKNHNKKVVVEIETGKSDYIKNIKRALEAGFDEIICVATTKAVEEKIRQELETNGIYENSIKLLCAKDIDIWRVSHGQERKKSYGNNISRLSRKLQLEPPI